jgi:hypothetical protein
MSTFKHTTIPSAVLLLLMLASFGTQQSQATMIDDAFDELPPVNLKGILKGAAWAAWAAELACRADDFLDRQAYYSVSVRDEWYAEYHVSVYNSFLDDPGIYYRYAYVDPFSGQYSYHTVVAPENSGESTHSVEQFSIKRYRWNFNCDRSHQTGDGNWVYSYNNDFWDHSLSHRGRVTKPALSPFETKRTGAIGYDQHYSATRMFDGCKGTKLPGPGSYSLHVTDNAPISNGWTTFTLQRREASTLLDSFSVDNASFRQCPPFEF